MMPPSDKQTFWEHLDELRTVLLRIIAAAVAAGAVAFCFKDRLFGLVLAPKSSDFITYRLFNLVCDALGFEPPAVFSVSLINTGLAEQFMVHMETALWMGVLCVSPYILYALFRFPGMYQVAGEVANMITLRSYMGTLMMTCLCLGVVFNMPVVAAVITPKSDVFTLLLVALPMYLLYELSILVCR